MLLISIWSSKDGRVLQCDVTLEQYAVIQQFDEDSYANRLMAEAISLFLNMEISRVKSALQFWVEKGVLYQVDAFYATQESRQDSNIKTAKSDSVGSFFEKMKQSLKKKPHYQRL